MTPFVFDSLSASKQLREAGMPEGVAEAVVSVFQHASAMPDISHLSTKADLDAQSALLKADIDAQGALMKAGLDVMKADIGALKRDTATKADLAELRAEFGARLLQQTWMMIGGVTALVTMVNVTLKIFD
ncbi:MAG: CCDC90 family protein [Caulobacter sp.]|nr:CCDC90 family protein [Caulobacter sp.]